MPLRNRMAPETHWMAMKMLRAVRAVKGVWEDRSGPRPVKPSIDWHARSTQSLDSQSATQSIDPVDSRQSPRHPPAQRLLRLAGCVARRRPMQTKLASHMVTVEKVQSSPPMMMPFTG